MRQRLWQRISRFGFSFRRARRGFRGGLAAPARPPGRLDVNRHSSKQPLTMLAEGKTHPQPLISAGADSGGLRGKV